MASIPWVGQQPAPPPFGFSIESLLEEYLTDCRRRGLSPKTVDFAYAYPLQRVFLPWCLRAGVWDLRRLSTWLLDRFVGHLLMNGGQEGLLVRQSVITYIRTVNQFLTWATRAGVTEPLKARQPRAHRKLVDVLSRQEIERIEDAASRERDKLIVRLLADTGIRLGELSGLRPESVIDRDGRQYLHVTGKAQRDRLVPLIPSLYERLKRYSGATRPSRTDHHPPLSCSTTNPCRAYRSVRAVWRHANDQHPGKMAGIKKRVYPHLFRHSFATWALGLGMNPVQLKDILGHSSLSMITNVYCHLAPEDAYTALMAVMERGSTPA